MRKIITHLDWTVQIHVSDVLAPHRRVWQRLVISEQEWGLQREYILA